jgi:hypothetical protein
MRPAPQRATYPDQARRTWAAVRARTALVGRDAQLRHTRLGVPGDQDLGVHGPVCCHHLAMAAPTGSVGHHEDDHTAVRPVCAGSRADHAHPAAWLPGAWTPNEGNDNRPPMWAAD